MLSWRSDRNPCCGPKSARHRRVLEQQVGAVPEAAVDRCRVAEQPDAAVLDELPLAGEQPVDPGCDDDRTLDGLEGHGAIIDGASNP
jgi:hypothetical protein